MPLQFAKSERVSLKGHPDFTEKWVQNHIIADPMILGLDNVRIIIDEKRQPKAGRLDLVGHDNKINRRYEIELMLGSTDPSHIMRCIEYWDIERRRYPAYDHVAVLVAEDITSRFLNLMALLAGSIPLIAIQLVALKVDDKIVLHFVRVLDQRQLRTDDEYELGGAGMSDRTAWEEYASVESLHQCDKVLAMLQDLTREKLSLSYRRDFIYVLTVPTGHQLPVWLHPQKTQVRIGCYVSDPEAWVKQFYDAGQTANLRHGNKAVAAVYKPQDFAIQGKLLGEFLSAALNSDEVESHPTKEADGQLGATQIS